VVGSLEKPFTSPALFTEDTSASLQSDKNEEEERKEKEKKKKKRLEKLTYKNKSPVVIRS